MSRRPVAPTNMGVDEFVSGLALLYMGPDGKPDPYVHRLMAAMKAGDFDELEHVSALMIVLLHGRGVELPDWVTPTWLSIFKAPT